jgi:DNA topoisomerase-3
VSHHAIIPNVNTVADLRLIWPRLSKDERLLFMVIARSYLAALMPDFRYRQTTASLDVGGAAFQAVGRQPIEIGWRAVYGEEDERQGRDGEDTKDDRQMLPPLRDGETVGLSEPVVEAKETKPPPRYSEGTLIEAMANAWRFVENPEHRERLKEAKGIGTPATRAEIIQGLKRQELLAASGKHIVPTERGLALFGVLEKADGALVDPAVTAKLEFLLDEVLVGRRRAEEAIDAVCGQAARIIGRLLEGASSDGAALPAVSSKPAGMGAGAARKTRQGARGPGAVSQGGRARRRPIAGTANSSAGPGGSTPAQTSSVRSERTATGQPGGTIAHGPKRPGGGRDRPTRVPPATADGTSLRIPFGNKEVALRLGARYRPGGWFAPAGTNLEPFREKGWL